MFTFALDLQWNLFRYIVSIIGTSFGNKIYVDLILFVSYKVYKSFFRVILVQKFFDKLDIWSAYY